MNNLNSILIEGNLVRDPKIRYTAQGTLVCTFSFTVETWAKLAENCNNFGYKGRGVRVAGRLKQDRWNDHDGRAQSRVVIVAEHVEFGPEFEHSATEITDEADSENNGDTAEAGED
jgi:single-strand DNA-binding protein